MSNFKRAYTITIGQPYLTNMSPLGNNTLRVQAIEEYYATAELNGISLSKHQIVFDIKKGSTANSEKSTISIFNLSNDTVDYLITNADKSLVIKFEAGYEGSVKTLFKGTIDSVTDDNDTETRITKLVLGESTVNKKEANSFRAYPRNTNINNIVYDLIGDLGVPIGNVQPITENFLYPLKKTIHGHTATQLSKIADWYGFRFSIQNGAAYFIPEKSKFVQEAILVSGETGLIGTPKAITDKNTIAVRSNLPTTGLKVRCQLNAAIQPETVILVKSGDIDQTFKVTKVYYKGDYRGNDWECDIECKRVEAIIL